MSELARVSSSQVALQSPMRSAGQALAKLDLQNCFIHKFEISWTAMPFYLKGPGSLACKHTHEYAFKYTETDGETVGVSAELMRSLQQASDAYARMIAKFREENMVELKLETKLVIETVNPSRPDKIKVITGEFLKDNPLIDSSWDHYMSSPTPSRLVEALMPPLFIEEDVGDNESDLQLRALGLT